ncbi:MAG: hypothetical protein KBT27_13290 [Prevotellaceae bacterium]|nr:hypothetical protein [Candidatus Faecinaster equi]
MGTFKKFLNAKALESLQFIPNDYMTASSVTINNMNTIKLMYRQARSQTYSDASTTTSLSTNTDSFCQKTTMFYNLIPFASSDTLDDYDESQYEWNNGIGQMTYTRTRDYSNDGSRLVYTIQLKNNTASDMTVGSIKFRKCIGGHTDAEYRSFALVYAYYFDEPIAIPSGEIKSFEIIFEK